jgi:hypothetical protein
MRSFLLQIKNGKSALCPGEKERYEKYLKFHDGEYLELGPREEDSPKTRKFYHGAVLRLWAFLNGMDYKDNEILEFLHKHGKEEFNGEIVWLDGKQVKRGKSTKGLLSENGKQQSGYVERVINYLEENYGIDRTKVLNTKHYKDFRDRVYSNGNYDTYIDYLVDLGFLKR